MNYNPLLLLYMLTNSYHRCYDQMYVTSVETPFILLKYHVHTSGEYNVTNSKIMY